MNVTRSLASLLLVATASTVPALAQLPDPPYFTDVTAEAGLDGVQVFRISVADLDGDGYPDLLLHTAPDEMAGDVLDRQFLYLNVVGDEPGNPFSRKFVDFTAESGIRANRQGTNDGRHSSAAIFADVDNDGDLDMFNGVYHHRNYTLDLGRNEIMLNDGTARFTLGPVLGDPAGPIYNTAAEVFLDYDNDGNVDLFVGNWYCPSAGAGDWCVPGFSGTTDGLTYDRLYRGAGDGSFSDVTASAGLTANATVIYGIAAFDGDGDGLTDLFAPPYSHTALASDPRQWRNNGDGTFTQIQNSTNYVLYRGFLENVASFGSVPRDYNNDGDIDFFEVLTHGGNDTGKYSGPVANIAGVFSWDWSRVVGRGTEDPDVAHDGDHHVGWFDFDGDGLVDFTLTESGYSNNRIYLFHQASNHTFSPVTVDSGLNDINVNNHSPGNVVPVDFDLDGDEDLLVGLNVGIRLYRNDIGTLNNWIAITLEGVGAPGYANKSAIGAMVEVTANGVTQTREVYAGPGHQGPQTPLALTFGLAGATSIERIGVRWPNSTLTVSEMTDVAVNQHLTIREPCDYATDPTNLAVDRDVDDVKLSWDDPAAGWTWNVYRDGSPDPSAWGAPHAAGVTDEDPGTPGIQYTDVGAAPAPSGYYVVTAVNVCGETPLR
jgi:hypothetical protein